MSYWNHRLVLKKGEGKENVVFEVHEVYYSEEGEIESWTERAIGPYGESENEAFQDACNIVKAFQKPILALDIQDGNESLKEISNSEAVNGGHYFEFMDRSSVALDYLYRYLGSHPLLNQENELKNLYEKVEKALSELYQAAGGKYLAKSQQDDGSGVDR